MLTDKDFTEILYQVKHSTGIVFRESEKNLILTLKMFCNIYGISKELVLKNYILAVHDAAKRQHFNWNYD